MALVAKSCSKRRKRVGTVHIFRKVKYLILNSFFSLFQTIEFLFAMCGPLKLPARRAVLTDECYNGGFMFGR